MKIHIDRVIKRSFSRWRIYLLQMEVKPIKNASSLLLFSGHSELETGLLPPLAPSYDKHSLETEIRVSPSGVILNSNERDTPFD